MPSISGSESDSPSVDSTQQPTPPHVDTGIDSPIESALPEADEPLSKDVLVADEPQQRPSADDSIGLQPAVLGGASETPMVPIPQRSPPAPDPNVDPHVDSVLSRVEYSTSEDVWIPDAEPLHPTPGSSSISMPLAWGGDPELSDGNPIAGKIEYGLPSMTPTLPGAPKRVIVGRNLGEPSPADMSGHQMQRRSPVGAESAYSGPLTCQATKCSDDHLSVLNPRTVGPPPMQQRWAFEMSSDRIFS
ncbi:LOW QUALITY PROTEIN: uncharacterized protein EMH_0019450 [Eimeria mitis]|uniref:Uncharacterized protein n=1 Tax=Eimeria mitis TaxID=44415 RepID=U6KDC9_9EIME|nr:LOW QUALITY PROTEIN: uncharacterized protein EMH_0019450 [Eimeria mitis]CDJ34257.1 hypothetical protein EMH_0019450 [Eimeria mitis]